MTNRAMLFGALYKLKVMHGQQTYSVCVGVAICVCVCGCYYVYIYKCIYVCVSLDCVWDMKRKQSNAPVSLPPIRLLSLWGVTFARLAATLDLYSFWETSGPVSQSGSRSSRARCNHSQRQLATTCCACRLLP